MSHVTYTIAMRKLSIRDLHATTGKIVRRARRETFLITDSGEAVAILKAATPADIEGVPFPRGHWKKHSPIVSSGESTQYVSDDRTPPA